jgi:hypothetical protein
VKTKKKIVAPPTAETEAAQRGIKTDRERLVRCRVCGCTEREPCYGPDGPCGWAEADLCTSCEEAVLTMCDWFNGAHRPSFAALLREYKRVVYNTPIPYVLKKKGS